MSKTTRLNQVSLFDFLIVGSRIYKLNPMLSNSLIQELTSIFSLSLLDNFTPLFPMLPQSLQQKFTDVFFLSSLSHMNSKLLQCPTYIRVNQYLHVFSHNCMYLHFPPILSQFLAQEFSVPFQLSATFSGEQAKIRRCAIRISNAKNNQYLCHLISALFPFLRSWCI